MNSAGLWQKTYQILLVLNFAISTTFHENSYIKPTKNSVISLSNESHFLGFLKLFCKSTVTRIFSSF